MPFHFSLQEVLDYRARIEDVRRGETAEMRRQVEFVENLIAQARRRRAHYGQELNEQLLGGGFAHQQLYLDYFRGLDVLIRKSEAHLAQLREDLERRRARLAEASRERQVMDELKKDEKRQYLLEERRAEGKDYDEIAIRNFLLSSREKSADPAERT